MRLRFLTSNEILSKINGDPEAETEIAVEIYETKSERLVSIIY